MTCFYCRDTDIELDLNWISQFSLSTELLLLNNHLFTAIMIMTVIKLLMIKQLLNCHTLITLYSVEITKITVTSIKPCL